MHVSLGKSKFMKRDSEATMFGVINEWKESGLPVERYAQKKGFTKSKLEYWIRKLEVPKNQEVPYPAFIELGSISAHTRPLESETVQTAGKLQIELTFPSGLCLKIFG
jgi:hypothetical protein